MRRPTIQTYKSDARSTVWRVQAIEHEATTPVADWAVDRSDLRWVDVLDVSKPGGWVLKRYEYAPWRQRLGLMCRVHPGQIERRGIERLRRAGIDVVPVSARGVIQGRYVQVMPWCGRSLLGVFSLSRRRGDHRLESVNEALASLVVQMFAAELIHTDLKLHNIIVTRPTLDGKPISISLIDAGAVRFSRSAKGRRQTLGVLMDTVTSAGGTWADRQRLVQAMRRHGVDASLLAGLASPNSDSPS